jgi:aerobic-type carbon monoxide dehydrogenase small subunit (CoxS/CutS family)
MTRSLSYLHPFLNAEAHAVDMIDGLRAAKAHIAAESATKASAQLLISGYSEGGFVAMATHKVIERDHSSEFTVT